MAEFSVLGTRAVSPEDISKATGGADFTADLKLPGLLTGKMRRDTKFDASDHRNYNRHGESFDVGETFSGVDYETGLAFVEEMRALLPAGATMAQAALRWILMFDGVTAAIPGAKNPEQARANAAAADLAPLPADTMAAIAGLYTERIKPLVHQRW